MAFIDQPFTTGLQVQPLFLIYTERQRLTFKQTIHLNGYCSYILQKIRVNTDDLCVIERFKVFITYSSIKIL